MSEADTILHISGLGKSYPGVQALSNVNLELKEGEVHALVGENGAGKSTLAKIVAGLIRADAGEMTFRGQSYSPSGKLEAERLGIRMVMQELNLISTLSVAENIFLNQLPGTLGVINRKQLLSRARKIMAEVGLEGVSPDTQVGSLGVGQQQMVEIAAGLSSRCEILFLDEPTAALTDSEIKLLFKQIERLKQEGVCIVYISHRMEEIKQVSDTITVLRDGVIRGTRKAADVSISEIIRLMVGRELGDIHRMGDSKQGSLALRAENLSRSGRVRNVSFELFKGEILGFAGMMGSGRTELMRLIFGADHRDTGKIYLKGADIPAKIESPVDAVRSGIALLTEDRKEQGLLMSQSVTVNTSLARMQSVSNAGWIDSKSETAVAEKYVSDLAVKCHSVDQEIVTLSGGNQQKVVVAKWLHRDPEILIFDEPTRGIDVGAKFEIYNLLNKLSEQGRPIMMVSSDMLELFAICDRIAVMSNGVLAGIFNRDEWSQDKVMEAALSGYS